MFAALAFGVTVVVAVASVPAALVLLGLLPLLWVIPGALQQTPPFGEEDSMDGPA